jgi:hypothetical protein
MPHANPEKPLALHDFLVSHILQTALIDYPRFIIETINTLAIGSALRLVHDERQTSYEHPDSAGPFHRHVDSDDFVW